MAVNIVVAIGGTGSRAAEAFVYAAATGLLNNDTKTYVFIADKDVNCGNTQRLIETLSAYEAFHAGTGLTMPNIIGNQWCFEQAMKHLNEKAGGRSYQSKPVKFRDVVIHNNDPDDFFLADLMHSEEEQNFQLDYGFYGHPSLGAAIYALITQTATFNDPETNVLLKTINKELESGQEVHVFLYGSVFGGTGASLFPNVARSIHNSFRGAANEGHLHIGGALMLPYFCFGAPKKGEEPVVKYGDFLEKTSVALSHYALDKTLLRTDDLPRNDKNHHEAAFDAMYLFGSLPLEPTCPLFVLGGADQTHTFAVADLYAALAAVEFFNGNVAPLPDKQPRLFTAHMPDGDIDWNALPNADIQAKAEQMVCFCAACLTVLHPMFLRPVNELRKYNVLIHLFGGHGFINQVADLPPNFDPAAELDSLVPFCRSYLCFWQNLHNRNYDPAEPPYVSFFYDNALRALETYLHDPVTNGFPTHEWFRDNYPDPKNPKKDHVLKHFQPDGILLPGRQRALSEGVLPSLALQNALDAHVFEDEAGNVKEGKYLIPVYRATYNLLGYTRY